MTPKTLVPRFQRALRELLATLLMPEEVVRREIDVDGGFRFGRTASRRVVGVLTELAFLTEGQLHSGGCANELELSRTLSGVPIGGLEHGFPQDAARVLLAPGAPKVPLW